MKNVFNITSVLFQRKNVFNKISALFYPSLFYPFFFLILLVIKIGY